MAVCYARGGFLCQEVTRDALRGGLLNRLGSPATPAIVVGCDGTGKTTLINEVRGDKTVLKFTRESADGWMNNPKLALWTIYDRHPVIDWPVYEAVRDPSIDVREMLEQWFSLPVVRETLYGATIVWLTHQYAKTAEDRDLSFVVGKDDRIKEMYEEFFSVAKDKDITMLVLKEVTDEQ